MDPHTPTTVRRGDAVAFYYLATPLFALGDYVFDMPVRIAGLEDPLHRGVYYAALMACGVLCRARPETTPWVGMLESAGNITLLILSIMLPVWALPDAFESGAELVSPFAGTSIATVIMSGTALLVSFYRHQHAALTRGAAPRMPDL